jgi:alkanesulfonate monooxygenase SsuD/methylene tetrahydromethanopterin reductase-like flavin-dependent oxidoreductase (luciferase family)|tara:strand:- start:153 stop:1169 length:1017 start_codon:yes stop_codon:yes gene_type:complete
MKFCQQLSSYLKNKKYTGYRLYQDMYEQAILCDQGGYDSVGITEHHLINILMMPAPLQFAVKITGATKKIKIITAVAVLPIHDMRVFAGEVIAAQMFTDNRLILGVGRGAFACEMAQLDSPLEDSREKFNESLEVLQKLLSEEEVSWHGKHYNFESLTVMPRPMTENGPSIMMAVLDPEGIYACTKRGFHIMTTPLSGDHQLMLDQVDGFARAKAELGDKGKDLSISLSRVAFIVKNELDRKEKIEMAYEYYSRFDNVFTGPGIVNKGMIKVLPRKQSIEELAESLLVCTAEEMIDKLSPYKEVGIDRVILNMNFGASHDDTMESIHRFSEDVIPYFS